MNYLSHCWLGNVCQPEIWFFIPPNSPSAYQFPCLKPHHHQSQLPERGANSTALPFPRSALGALFVILLLQLIKVMD